MGLDGKVYALTASSTLYTFDPNSMALLGTVALPAGHDYRGVAVNQYGEIFTANWDNSVSHFTAGGALLATVNLTGPGDGSWFGNPMDVKVASDGTLALGTRSGQVVQMTSAFTGISYIHTWTGSVQYPCFVNFAPAAPPGLPTVSISDYAAFEGNSGTRPFTFTLTLSAASSNPVTVNFTTANGTATAGSDYQALSGSVTFAPGQTTQTITVLVNGDTTYEPDETFFVNLTGVAGGATLGRSSATGTIRNDDLPSLTIYNYTLAEGNAGTTSAYFTVYLSAASSQTVTVNYSTSDGTATAGSDYQATSGTLTFAPGQTSATVAVLVNGDTVDEPDETFYVNLSGPVNATLANTSGRGTILNDDLTVSVGDVSVLEGNSGTTPAYFTISLSAASTHSVTVGYYTAGGTATAGSDYSSTSGTLTFAPGQTSITVPVSVIGDTIYEGNETFNFYLTGVQNAAIARGVGTGTIIDDDATPSLSISDYAAYEGNSGTTAFTFTVTLSAASGVTTTVNYATADGTATASSGDYRATSGTLTFAPGQTSKTITVLINGDTLQEVNETFNVNLSGAVGASIARPQATGTIIDDDTPALTVSSVSALEGNSGTTAFVFTVGLVAPSTRTISVSVFTADGTATSGSGDYRALSTTVTFTPGQTSQTVTVMVNGDTLYEPNEIFYLNAWDTATYNRAQGVGTILNDDPLLTLTVIDTAAYEGNSGYTSMPFTVYLSAASGQTVTVNYSTADGTAVAGSDYLPASGTLTFAPGQTSQTGFILLPGDTTPEPTKTFTINLSSPTNAGLARSSATATVLNDDGPTISIYNSSVAEGNSGTTLLNFIVQLSAASTQPVSVSYASSDNGSATAGVDYQAVSGTLTFNPGETSKIISVPVYGDTTYEDNETFYLRISNGNYGVVGSTNYLGVGTILNDDPMPTLSVNDISVVEGNSGTTNAVFRVSLSAASGLGVGVYYNTLDGTATAGSDYNTTSNYLFIPAGQTSATVTVGVRGDTTIEADETFVLNLYNPVSATLARPQGTCTIVNDDFPVVSVAPASILEGNSGVSYMAFTLSLSAPSPQAISVNYATSDIVSAGGGGPSAATAGVDYQATSGMATFAPGQTTATMLVAVYGDKLVEPDESFALGLSNPVHVTLSSIPGAYGTILNEDHAPVASAGPNQTVNEGATVLFDGSGSSDADGDPLTYTWNFGDGGTGSGVNPTHVYADNGVYTVTLSVSDGANTSTGTMTVTVQNVAPTVSVSGPTDTVPGEDRTFTFAATDPSPVDQAATFTYQINWGDGTTQTVSGPASGVQVIHVFTATGSASVTATATDKDGGTGAAVTQTVTTVAAELQGGDLVVGGTTGDDHIVLQPSDASGSVDVVVNGHDQGTFAPTGKVVVYGQAGNDLIEVVPLTAGDGSQVSLALPVMLFGGEGDDTLDARGESGPAVLSGGRAMTPFGGAAAATCSSAAPAPTSSTAAPATTF